MKSVHERLQLALAHHRAGQLAPAESIYREILAASPNHPAALYLLGFLACQTGQFTTALELTDRAIRIQPGLAEAHLTRGDALNGLRKYKAALEGIDRAIVLNPALADAHVSRGNALHGLKRYARAVDAFDHAIRLQPEHAGAHINRAIALYSLARYQAALESSDRAIELQPDFAEAHLNRGNALQALGQHQAAVESYSRAIQLRPDYTDAYYNRGVALQALARLRAAIASYDQAIALAPTHAEAHLNRGVAHLALLDYPAALADFDSVIALNPDSVDAHNNRGNTLLALQQYLPALESFNAVARLKPGYDWLPGMRVHIKSLLCDWDNIEAESRGLEAAILHGERAVPPFVALAISDLPAVHRRAAETCVSANYAQRSALAPLSPYPRHTKLRIGYFSADYCNHATSSLMAEVFERHDRTRFEIFGFSFGPNTVDPMRQRITNAMDRFLDVRSQSDREIAELARSLEIDIAVDLKGFTTESRPGIFSHRAAPIQINYLGYPGTMGAPFIDYLIADRTVIPESAQHHYSEKIIYLPGTYQPNASYHPAPTETTREAHHLPETAFVFCCFNNAYKITPSAFDSWMRILARVPSSVLWLLETNPWAAANLRREAARRGIAPERLIFAPRLPEAEHLARQPLANLFLDTFPYNAHTTASDALRAGVPVLTRIGESFPSRVAASLISALSPSDPDLPDLITRTPTDYEQLAVILAHDPALYRTLRTRLQHNRATTRLFDCSTFTRGLESIYLTLETKRSSF